MDRFIESIHQRLLAWGEWAVKRKASGLGFAQCRYDYQSVIGSGVEGGEPVEFEILETEAMVQTLPQQLREMVIAFYTRIGSAEAVAKTFGVSKDTLERRVGRAHRMIQSGIEVRATLRAVKRQQIPLAPVAAKAV